MALKEFWNKENYLETYGIHYKTYKDYVTGRSTLYTGPGSRLGCAAKKAKKTPVSLKSNAGRQPDHKASDRGAQPMSQFLWMFAHFDGFASHQLLGELERKRKTHEQESYERIT